MQDDLQMDTRAAALYLFGEGGSPRTLEHYRYVGTGPRYYRLGPGGRLVRYRRSDLDAWMRAQVVEPGQEGADDARA